VTDVVVVGAGIVGAAVARELAIRGVDVTLTLGADYSGLSAQPGAGAPTSEPATTATTAPTGIPQPKGAPSEPSC